MRFWRRRDGRDPSRHRGRRARSRREPGWEPDAVRLRRSRPGGGGRRPGAGRRRDTDRTRRRPCPAAPPLPVAATSTRDCSGHAVGSCRGCAACSAAATLGGPSWDEVEETLIAGDVGATLAIELVERARARRDPGGPEAAVRAELAALLVPRDLDWTPRSTVPGGPAVVLVVGVNGTGKTTTIGKLASRYAGEGQSVILAAADTFRAAAIEQLRIWADRAGVPVVAHAPGADPGAVVYDALDAAVARGADLVIADTAGRLHTRTNLMDELAKVRRIVDKRLPGRHARDALRPRRHDRTERAGAGEGVPRRGRADRDRPDQARFDCQGRDRLRDRARPRRPGPLRRGGGGRRRPDPVRSQTRSWRRCSPDERSAADRLVALDLDHDGRDLGQDARRRSRRLR